MKTKFSVICSFLFLLVVNSPSMAVDMELLCPSSAVAPGAAVSVTVTNVENWEPFAEVTINRYAAGFIVNSTNTIGGAGFYGPFLKTTPAKTVPAAASPAPENNWMGSPGTIPNFGVSVGTVPPEAAGKMAMVYVSFLTTRGQEVGGGSCLVNIQ